MTPGQPPASDTKPNHRRTASTAAASSSAWPGPAPASSGRQRRRARRRGPSASRPPRPRQRPARRLHVRPDQRQPHRLRQGAEQATSTGHAPGGRRPDQRPAAAPRPADPHRRPHPPGQAGGVRHRRPDPQGRQGRRSRSTSPASTTSSATTASCTSSASARGRAATAGTASTTAASTSSAWSTSPNLKPGGLGILGDEQLDWLKKDLEPLARQHADRRVRPRAALDGLPEVGLGHGGRRSRRWRCSGASARSPCSTATSTRCCRRSRATSPSTPPARPPSPSPSRARPNRPAR